LFPERATGAPGCCCRLPFAETVLGKTRHWHRSHAKRDSRSWLATLQREGRAKLSRHSTPLAPYPAAQEGMSSQHQVPMRIEQELEERGPSSMAVTQDPHRRASLITALILFRTSTPRTDGPTRRRRATAGEKERRSHDTGARAPLSLFPGPNVSMDQSPGPLDALAESSTERTPTMSHLLVPVAPSSRIWKRQVTTRSRQSHRQKEIEVRRDPPKTRYRAAKY